MSVAVIIIVLIAVTVWVLSTVFGGNQNARTPPRPRSDDDLPRRRPMARVQPAPPPRQPRVTRPAPRQPIVLEEVIEPPPQTSLQSTRAGYTPTQSPSKTPVEKPFPAPPPAPTAPQTSLESARADYAPTQSPSKTPTDSAAKPLPVSPTLLQVRQLLKSPKSAAAAFVLREILDAPRCRATAIMVARSVGEPTDKSACSETESLAIGPYLCETGRMNQPSPQSKFGEPYTPDYEEEPYSEDGVDLTLIRWMLSLTPAERLQVAQSAAQSLTRLKDARSSTT